MDFGLGNTGLEGSLQESKWKPDTLLLQHRVVNKNTLGQGANQQKAGEICLWHWVQAI